MNAKNKLLLFFCLLLIQYKATAQGLALLSNDSLDRYIKQALTEWQIPGAAVCIVKDGRIILQQGYGVKNNRSQQPVTEHTVFPIASVTKTFTGVLLATLEAEGRVSLGDPVKKWLPQFSMTDKLYEQQITLMDVLSHRSGWKTFQGDFINTESDLSVSQMIQLFGKQIPAYPIRTRFGYSNFGFMMAGECVKAITQKSWNEYLHGRLLAPLGMTRTLVFEDDIRREKDIVTGYTRTFDTIQELPPDRILPYSHGGLFASIQDLGIWMQVLLNKGNAGGKNIIPESAIQKVWLSNTIIGKSRAADREQYFKTYGLGWEIIQYQNTEVIQHNGAYSGALSSLALVPGLNLGIAILTNQDSHLLHETLKWQVIDACLNRYAPDYTKAALMRQQQRKQENSVRARDNRPDTLSFAIDLKNIEGTYYCDYYGKATIQEQEGVYVVRFEHHPQLVGTFSPHKQTQLLCTYNHPMFGKMPFPFVIDRNQVKSFTMFVDGFVETDGYEFVKIR